LTYHLERKHPEEHRKVITAQGKTKTAQTPSKMVSTAVPFLSINDSKHGGVKPYDKSNRQAKQLVNATAQFISLSLQPIRVVDEPSFRNLLSTADTQFELPHRTHFSTRYMEIAPVQYCTITTGLWTANHQDHAYISLTLHCVDSCEFSLNSLCLQTLEVPKEHTAASFQQVLSSMLNDWGILSKVLGATTDNSQNLVNAIELLGLEHFPCLALTLQLAVKKAMWEHSNWKM